MAEEMCEGIFSKKYRKVLQIWSYSILSTKLKYKTQHTLKPL